MTASKRLIIGSAVSNSALASQNEAVREVPESVKRRSSGLEVSGFSFQVSRCPETNSENFKLETCNMKHPRVAHDAPYAAIGALASTLQIHPDGGTVRS